MDENYWWSDAESKSEGAMKDEMSEREIMRNLQRSKIEDSMPKDEGNTHPLLDDESEISRVEKCRVLVVEDSSDLRFVNYNGISISGHQITINDSANDYLEMQQNLSL